MGKPKVAFFDFACCEGCQIEITNYGDEAFLELLDHVEVVEFREAMSREDRRSPSTSPSSRAASPARPTAPGWRRSASAPRSSSPTAPAPPPAASTRSRTTRRTTGECVYGNDAGHAAPGQSQKALPISAAIKVDYTATAAR